MVNWPLKSNSKMEKASLVANKEAFILQWEGRKS
jgi:hypothetical protein